MVTIHVLVVIAASLFLPITVSNLLVNGGIVTTDHLIFAEGTNEFTQFMQVRANQNSQRQALIVGKNIYKEFTPGKALSLIYNLFWTF